MTDDLRTRALEAFDAYVLQAESSLRDHVRAVLGAEVTRLDWKEVHPGVHLRAFLIVEDVPLVAEAQAPDLTWQLHTYVATREPLPVTSLAELGAWLPPPDPAPDPVTEEDVDARDDQEA